MTQVIREFQPGIILTREPEHYMSDLVPGRRPFMVLVLEAISLAGRPYALDELPGLKPFLSFNKENYIPRGRLWGIWFDDILNMSDKVTESI